MIVAALVACLCLAPLAQAEQTSQAEAALRSSIDDILAILDDPAYADGANRAERNDKLRAHIHEIFDFKALTARALGVHWRQFSPVQQDDAARAMADLLEVTYRDALDKYNEQRVEYLESRELREDQVEIRTQVVSNGQSLPIHYRMERQENAWRIYDVVIEGVSLVQNYRTQFQEIMLRKSPDELIAMLKDKAAARRNDS
jgi:phospholipid transport system substrate-binding protein